MPTRGRSLPTGAAASARSLNYSPDAAGSGARLRRVGRIRYMRHCEYQPGRIWWNQRSPQQESSRPSNRSSAPLRTRRASASSTCCARVHSESAISSRSWGFRNPRRRDTWRTFASRGWSSTSGAASGASTSSQRPIPPFTRSSSRPCVPPDRARPGPTMPRSALCGGLEGAVRSTPVLGELEPMAAHLPEAGQPAHSASSGAAPDLVVPHQEQTEEAS